ncbi:SIMPL domain-containing protein [Shimia sp.]|uniref:SIMPL domain-containing protein n=1 Tax=Shimia sp. TaxID=1954381 RepID=UPI00329A6005
MRFGLVVLLLSSLAGGAFAQDRTISLNGTGVVSATPDMAVISLGATHRAKTAKAAMAAVNASVTEVLTELAEEGIDARDIQTNGLSLNAVRDHNNYGETGPKLVGFEASNRLSIRVRDLGEVGEILGVLIAVGANGVDGIRFDLQEPRPRQDEARRLAVADARAKAELYAEAAGVQLGEIVSISEAGRSEPRLEMMRESAMSDSVPIAAGELSIQSQVMIVWALVD